jgi:hypothetical protein
MQHTNVEDNTNAQFVATPSGCRGKDHQLKVFTKIFAIRKILLQKKIVYNM